MDLQQPEERVRQGAGRTGTGPQRHRRARRGPVRFDPDRRFRQGVPGTVLQRGHRRAEHDRDRGRSGRLRQDRLRLHLRRLRHRPLLRPDPAVGRLSEDEREDRRHPRRNQRRRRRRLAPDHGGHRPDAHPSEHDHRGPGGRHRSVQGDQGGGGAGRTVLSEDGAGRRSKLHRPQHSFRDRQGYGAQGRHRTSH